MSCDSSVAKTKDRILLHDICNQLSTVKLALYLVGQKEKVSEAEKYLNESEKAIKNIEALIQKYRDHLE